MIRSACRAREDSKKMAEALVARGDRAFVNEEFSEAVELYTQARTLGGTAAPRPAAAAPQHRQGSHAVVLVRRAAPVAPQALEVAPLDASAYGARAHAQLKLDNFLEAVEDASKAIELDPKMARAYLHKG